MNATTSFMPMAASSGEITCSKRCDASVRSLSACAVRRTETPSKFADSITMFSVSWLIAAGAPPLIPAMPIGRSVWPSVIRSIVIRERILLSIERDHPFALFCFATVIAYFSSRSDSLPRIERMQRLADIEHDVIRRIDDIVDRALADRFEEIPKPFGRWPDLYTANVACDIARTERRFIYFDGDRIRCGRKFGDFSERDRISSARSRSPTVLSRCRDGKGNRARDSASLSHRVHRSRRFRSRTHGTSGIRKFRRVGQRLFKICLQPRERDLHS